MATRMVSQETDHPAGSCPGASCFELLGRKWTGYLIWALMDGPRRFSELKELTPGLADRMLTVRLRSLEAAGIVTRHQYPEIPVRVEYALTERGRDLSSIIAEMERWGRRWGTSPALSPAIEDSGPGT